MPLPNDFDVRILGLFSKFHINSAFSSGVIESIMQKGFEKKSGNRRKVLLGFHKYIETGFSLNPKFRLLVSNDCLVKAEKKESIRISEGMG